MITRTLIASAAAALISAGSLGVSTTSASAHFAPGGPGMYGPGFGPGGPSYPAFVPGPGGPGFGPGGPGFGPGFKGGFGKNGWYFNFGFKPERPKPIVEKVCQPTYKTIQAWQPHFGWVWQTVYAGQVCQLVPIHRNW